MHTSVLHFSTRTSKQNAQQREASTTDGLTFIFCDVLVFWQKRRGNIFSPTHKPICQRITSGPRNSINAKPTQLNAENRKATQKSCNPFLFWPRFAVFCLLRPFFRVSLTTRRPDKSNDIR